MDERNNVHTVAYKIAKELVDSGVKYAYDDVLELIADKYTDDAEVKKAAIKKVCESLNGIDDKLVFPR